MSSQIPAMYGARKKMLFGWLVVVTLGSDKIQRGAYLGCIWAVNIKKWGSNSQGGGGTVGKKSRHRGIERGYQQFMSPPTNDGKKSKHKECARLEIASPPPLLYVFFG